MAKARKVSTKTSTKRSAPDPFTLEGAKFYGPLIAKVVNAALAQYGVQVESHKSTYGVRAQCLLRLSVGGESADARTWQSGHELYGLPADGLGRQIVHGGKNYTIVGLRPSKRSKPVVLKLEDDPKEGRVWFAPVSDILSRLNAPRKKSRRASEDDEADAPRRRVKTRRTKKSAGDKLRDAMSRAKPKTSSGKRLKKAFASKGKAGRRVSTF